MPKGEIVALLAFVLFLASFEANFWWRGGTCYGDEGHFSWNSRLKSMILARKRGILVHIEIGPQVRHPVVGESFRHRKLGWV